MSEVSITQVKENLIWDGFVHDSPDGTIFHKTIYLNSIKGIEYSSFFLHYKGSIRAGCILIHPSGNRSIVVEHDQNKRPIEKKPIYACCKY